MNNNKQALDTPVIDDSLIRAYLEENPDFFERHDDLLNSLTVSHERKGTVSLVERQQQKLRERVNQLEEEITELMINARRNEAIFKAYSELYVRLLKCRTLQQAIDALRNTFEEDLGLSALTLKLFDSPIEVSDQLVFAADTHRQLLSKRFDDSPIYLGRLTEQERKLLFQDEAVHSVALMSLGEQGEVGMFAVGSGQADHFEPAMDPLLINQLQALLSALLPRLLLENEAA